jgi:hypothetical protein
MKAPILYSPMMGLGASLDVFAETPAVVIEDFMFESTTAYEITPLASGTVSDFHDTWDLDGTDFTPEALPDDEGYWDNNETDLVTNGDFSSGTGWSGSASISGGQLTKTSAGLAYQVISGLQAGNEYIVVVDVETVGAANQVYLGGTSSSNLVAGIQTINIIAGSSNTFLGFNNGNTSTVINSISLVSNDIFPLDV